MPTADRILLITHAPPFPTNNGGRQRTALLKAALEQIAPVDLFLTIGAPQLEPTLDAALRTRHQMVATVCTLAWEARRAPWGWLRSAWPTLVDHVARQLPGGLADRYVPSPEPQRVLQSLLATGRYRLIVGRYLQPTAVTGALHQSAVPVCLDVDDLDTAVLANRLATPHGYTGRARWVARGWQKPLAAAQAALLSRCAHVWVAHPDDLARVGSLTPTSRLPNIPFRVPGTPAITPLPPTPGSQTLLFVGSLNYHANERSLDRFLETVWPLVRSRVPSARLRLVGAGVESGPEARWSATTGVDVIGEVADLRPEYARAAAVVVPVFDGGGTTIKLLEALAYGRPCVATPYAWSGFQEHLGSDTGVDVGDTDMELAAACIRLLHDPVDGAHRAARGATVVAAAFSEARVSAAVRGPVAALWAAPAQAPLQG